MDYALAILRNRDLLKAIVLTLFALAGGLTSPLRGPKAGETRGSPWPVPGLAGRREAFPLFLPRSTIAAIMLVLRPAESAVRRLIVIAAFGLKLNDLAKSAAALTSPLRGPQAGETGGSPWSMPGFAGRRGAFRAFALFDPLKSFDPEAIWDVEPPYESGYNLTKSVTWHDASTDHTPMDARPLALRLNALMRALNDLPRQARRLKRWEAKRDAALQSLMLRCEQREPRSTHPTWHPRRLSPMRPGLPPGWRQRKIHEIDVVFRECHGLANDRLNAPNSS